MEHNEPQEPDPQGPAAEPAGAEPAGAAHDALRRLEERLGRASDAAERLIAEAASAASASAGRVAESAARAAGGAGAAGAAGGTGAAGAAGGAGAGGVKPPPAGWQTASSEPGAAASGDSELLVQLIHSLRELIPPELQRRLAEALREVLLAIRALIDWYLERADQRRAEPAEAQDIPIL